MKILVTGSTGLVGTALVSSLMRQGHTVCRLIRPGTTERDLPEERGGAGGFAVSWNPETGELGGAGVSPDAVVNLAGASIADGRWSAKRKVLLRTSRVAQAFLDGAGPAAIGAILGSAILLAGTLREPWQFAVLAGAAVLLLGPALPVVRRGVVPTLLAAAATGLLIALAGGPLPH